MEETWSVGEISMRMARREFRGGDFIFQEQASLPLLPDPAGHDWHGVPGTRVCRPTPRELYWGSWDGRWASSGNGDSSGGFFNVATPVITSALTGDDSPSPPRGFTGSSGQSGEKERERKRANTGWNWKRVRTTRGWKRWASRGN